MGRVILNSPSRKITLEIIGGPLLINWRLYAIATPFVFVFSILINANLLIPGQVTAVVMVAFLSTGLMFGWSILFDKTFFRNRHEKPINLAWVVFFGFGMGVVKSISSELLFVWLGLFETSLFSLFQRALPVGLAALTLVLVVPLFENNRIQYQVKRDSLVGSLVQQELDQKKSYFDDIDLDKIAAGIQKVRTSSSSSQASERLRELVEKVIRPQSHKLWKKESSRFPNFTFAELLGHAILNRPFNPILSSLLTALGIFLFNIFREAPDFALARTFIVWAIVFVIYLIASQIKVTTVKSGIWLFGFVVVLSSVISTYASVVLVGEPFFSIAFITFLVYFFWQLLNTLVVAGVKAIFDNSKSVEEELAKLNESGALDSSVREIIGRINSRELADHLHSTVQNQVLATSLRLEKGNLNQEQIAKELDVLESILESDALSGSNQTQGDLETELEDIKLRWEGFVEINCSLNVKIAQIDSKRVQQVLEEAISNAVRHGHAESIDVLIAESGENIFISVTDDGFGPRGGKPGLGNSLFETASSGRWKLEAIDAGGSRLIVLV